MRKGELMINVLINGALGKMGKTLTKAVEKDEDLKLVGAVDITIKDESESNKLRVFTSSDLKKAIEKTSPDIVVDFTQPSSVYENAKMCLESNTNIVIGTTGLSEDQIKNLEALSKQKGAGCLIAPNFSTGAVLMMKFAEIAAQYFDNAEIIEFHHNQKKDAPSGTAVKTAQMMANTKPDFTVNNCVETETIKGSRGGISKSNIHIHSVRMPGFMASQEVIFGGNGQTLKIIHDSHDRECYMPGIILAIKHIAKTKEFIYGLENIL